MESKTDNETSLGELKAKIAYFCELRDWDPFHDMKELAIGLATESAELLDLMRFKRPEQVAHMLHDPVAREKIADELADICWMLFRFSQLHGIDLSQSVLSKMAKNELKYPVNTSKGSNRKYNEL
jgi:NTP pyrophosphatase (non-canonical NTP hydrolase)